MTAAALSGWRDAFLAGGKASLKSRPADARAAEIGRLKEKVGDLTMVNERLGAKLEHLEVRRPLPARMRGPVACGTGSSALLTMARGRSRR